jgi:hypothetical protein
MPNDIPAARCSDTPSVEIRDGVIWHSWNGHTWWRGEPAENTRLWPSRVSARSTIEEGEARSHPRSDEEDRRTRSPSES